MKAAKIKDPFELVEKGQGTKIFKNKHTLKISYVPDQLPEREKEIEKLKWHLKDALEGTTPNNIFIYGYTGVGKTACCRKVLRDLHEKVIEQKISNIRTMYLNCATTHSECQVIGDIANFF
ncbi:MAG: AAA family ATPase, partial [Candidatus Hydrothermarchaeota archaeon]|nr:AAA family ATPase [Candidatus Hydrothermarchaeota archaeon]